MTRSWTHGFAPEDRDNELDRDRMVTLSVGQLTDAIAEALKVVSDAPIEKRWSVGDRALVEVEVTGTHRDSVNFKFADWHGSASFALSSDLLKEIE